MTKSGLTVEEIMGILPETARQIAALTKGVSPALLRASPQPDAWSVIDVLAHLRACHDVLGVNVIRIVAEDRPTWKGMSPRAWIRKTDYPTWAFEPAFAAFREQREGLLAVLDPLPADVWEQRTATVNEFGSTVERSAGRSTPGRWARPRTRCTGVGARAWRPRDRRT
jgi:hypothetical protein